MYLEELINQNYKQLNENDHYIWNYIKTHRSAVEKMSIEELAKKCHVSRTTILRFSKRLGLKGYSELKVYLRLDNQKQQDVSAGKTSFYQDYLSYLNTLKDYDFKKVIEIIDSSRNAYVYGTGSFQNNVCLELKRTFLEIGKLFFDIQSMNETEVYTEVIDQEDMILMISYSGENKHLIDFAKKLKTRGVRIVSITARHDNALSHMADVSLSVTCPSMGSLFGPRHSGLVNYFMLVDFLFINYLEYQERKVK